MNDYHWIFPLMAATIYLCTPKGCNRTINWVLTGLFVLIWSFEEAIIRINESAIEPLLTDGIWYDATISGLFLSVGILFYKLGGKVQFKLAMIGAGMSLMYLYWGNTGLYYDEFFRLDYYYVESMIALYLAQLFVSGGGMMFALSNKLLGGEHAVITGNNRNVARNSNAGHGDS